MTQTIEQLTARVRELETQLAANNPLLDEAANRIDELEEELEHIREQKNLMWFEFSIATQQLAASQAYAEQLREALNAWIGIASNCSIESGVCGCGEAMKNHSSPMMCGHSPVDMADSVVHSAIQKTDKALAIPRDTSALDSYVREKGVDHGWIHHNDWYDLCNKYSDAADKAAELCMKNTELTRQRDLAVYGLNEAEVYLAYCKPIEAMREIRKALSTIKESEGK